VPNEKLTGSGASGGSRGYLIFKGVDMDKKYIHSVCSCGCSNLIIPLGVNIDQLVLRCLVQQKQQYIRATIKAEEKTMHGWADFNRR